MSNKEFIPQKNSKTKWLFYSFVIIVIVQLFSRLGNEFSFDLPLLRYGLNFIALFLFLKTFTSVKTRLKLPSFFVKSLVYIFLFWNLIMILRGFPEILSGAQNHLYLKQFLSGHLFLYLLPFAILIFPDPAFLHRLLKSSYILSLIYIIITFLFFSFFLAEMRNGAEWYARVLAASSTIILLTYPYHSKRITFFSAVSLALALTLMGIFARRNMVAYFSAVFLFSALIMFFTSSSWAQKKKSSYLGGSIFFIISLVLVYFLFNPDFSLLEQRLLPGLKDREALFESRKGVIEDFKEDFDSNPIDWVVGRGIYGEFESRLASIESPEGTRDGIENGYYFAILKGGGVYLTLFVILSLFSIYLGFFKSKNVLSKAFASIVLIHLIDMVGFGVPSLSFKYFFVWVAIAGCLSYPFRNYADENLKPLIGLK